MVASWIVSVNIAIAVFDLAMGQPLPAIVVLGAAAFVLLVYP